MLEEEPQDEENEGQGAPKSKRLFAVGGVVGGLALAFLAAMMGVPRSGGEQLFQGPFVAPLTAEKVQVNLTGSKNFLVLGLNVTYDSYEESYFTQRLQDPLASAEIKDALVALASSKTIKDVSDPVYKPVFAEEIRSVVDPLIFPIHIGDAVAATDGDSASGIAPGLSTRLGTFRGKFEQHALRVDAVARTVQVDDGPTMEFKGHETDLELLTGDDLVLYLDVSSLDEEFVGELPIGVMGRVRRVLWSEVLIQ